MGKQRQHSVDKIVDAFSRWRPGAFDDEDLANLHLMLSVRRDYLSDDPCTWREGDVNALLLDVFPRKVQGDPSLLERGPAVLRSFLGFLEHSGRLRGSGLHQQEAELADIACRFPDAMLDTSKFGLAKSLYAAMEADGVALDDPAAVSHWIDGYNSRPHGRRAAVTGGALEVTEVEPEPLVLPPVTLLGMPDLQRAAAEAPLVRRVGALLDHVGPQGRPVTATGALRLVDATALAPACGDDDRLHRPQAWQGAVRRMADLPGVAEAYELAVDAELLDLHGSRVRRDPSQPGWRDEPERAAALADAALGLGAFLGEPPHHLADLADAVDGELPGVVALLYAAAEPVPVGPLAEHACEEIGGGPQALVDAVRGLLERVLSRLERLGMVERFGVHIPPERLGWGGLGEQTTSVALTPLGVWWLHRTLPSFGVHTPLVGELAAATAADLPDRLAGYAQEAGEAEIAGWVAARGEDAAPQLAQLLADADVGRRQFALHQLDRLPGAEEAVRPLLDDPVARPYALVWLVSNGHEVPEHYHHPDDDLLLFVETAGVMVGAGAIDEVVAGLSGLGAAERQVELVRRLWRAESPFTGPVLHALADAAPAPVSKAARKALHSLRSAGR